MKILVYGINYFPELTGIGKYTGEMCEWLASQGHEVEVITAMPYYPKWKIDKLYQGKGWHNEYLQHVKVLRSPLFVSQKVTARNRIIHEISFFLSSGFYWFSRFFKRYDVVISVYPPLVIGIWPLLHKLLHQKSCWVFHIQDLQVDAAKELNLIKNKKVLDLFFKIERFFLKKANLVTSISPGMRNKILQKGVSENKYFSLPNWVDVDFIKPLSKEESLKSEMGYEDHEKIVLYSGNLGEKQGLEMILEVAERFLHREDLYFLLAGEGGAKKRLIKMAQKKKLTNVIFSPLRSYEELSQFMNAADLHLVLQKKGAADLVLPSKLNTILSAGGVSIVSSEKGTSLYEMVEDNKVGIVIEPENSEALYQAIVGNIDKDNIEMKRNAREFALKYLNINSILGRFEDKLRDLVRDRKD